MIPWGLPTVKYAGGRLRALVGIKSKSAVSFRGMDANFPCLGGWEACEESPSA